MVAVAASLDAAPMREICRDARAAESEADWDGDRQEL